MPKAWRIIKERQAGTTFDGEGARLFGGRWNSPGVSVVYVSDSRALATLEILAGLRTTSPLAVYVLIPAEFDESLIVAIELDTLPGSWNQSPPIPFTQRMGNDWVASETSAVLRVPSALVPHESIYLLNPRHLDFSAVRVGKPEPLSLDPRLLR